MRYRCHTKEVLSVPDFDPNARNDEYCLENFVHCCCKFCHGEFVLVKVTSSTKLSGKLIEEDRERICPARHFKRKAVIGRSL